MPVLPEEIASVYFSSAFSFGRIFDIIVLFPIVITNLVSWISCFNGKDIFNSIEFDKVFVKDWVTSDVANNSFIVEFIV